MPARMRVNVGVLQQGWLHGLRTKAVLSSSPWRVSRAHWAQPTTPLGAVHLTHTTPNSICSPTMPCILPTVPRMKPCQARSAVPQGILLWCMGRQDGTCHVALHCPAGAKTCACTDVLRLFIFAASGNEPASLTHSALELEALASVHRNASKHGMAGSKLDGHRRTGGGEGARASTSGSQVGVGVTPPTPAGVRGAGAGRRGAADAAAAAAPVLVTTLPAGSENDVGNTASRSASTAQLAFSMDGMSPR